MKAQTISFVMVFLVFISCNNLQNGQTEKDIENIIKANLNTFIEDCWNKKDLTPLSSISTEDVIRKVNGLTISKNKNEMEASMTIYFIGFPDLVITNSNTYIKDNLAFIDFIFSGTNTGVFAEYPATGKKVKVKGFSILHYNDEGKMYMEDICYNELDLLQQLGYTLNPPILE